MPDESVQLPSAKFLLGLSGGGYRAAVYHLGMLARLDECGLLKDIDTISSVSGGSLLAGVLANEQHRALSSKITTAILNTSAQKVITHAVSTDLRSGPLISFWFIYTVFVFILSLAVVYGLKSFRTDFEFALTTFKPYGVALQLTLVFAIYLGSMFFTNVLMRTMLTAIALSVVQIGFGTPIIFVFGAAAVWMFFFYWSYQLRTGLNQNSKPLKIWLGRLTATAQLSLLFSPTITRLISQIDLSKWSIYDWILLPVIPLGMVFLLWASERWSAWQNINLARFYERSFLEPETPQPALTILSRFIEMLRMIGKYFKPVPVPVPKLNQLPADPRYVFNATLLNVGYPWQMTKDLVGNPRVGQYAQSASNLNHAKSADPLELPISEAVAISACFPPLFTPRRIKYPDRFEQFEVVKLATSKNIERSKVISERFTEAVRKTVFNELWLNDGGNFDNLGVDPLIERAAALKDQQDTPVEPLLLISDAGSDPLPTGLVNRFFLPLTYLSLIFRESRRQRIELLRTLFREDMLRGAYIGIGNRLERDGGDFKLLDNTNAAPFRFEDRMVNAIARIRTDLAPMSQAEAAALVIQGYVCTCVQLKKLKIGDAKSISNPKDLFKRFGLNFTVSDKETLEKDLARS